MYRRNRDWRLCVAACPGRTRPLLAAASWIGRLRRHVMRRQLALLPATVPQKEKVVPGDVIYIEANSGAVKRVGRWVSTGPCPTLFQPPPPLHCLVPLNTSVVAAAPHRSLFIVLLTPAVSRCTAPYRRCDAYATEYDLEAEEYVPLPKGDVHKRKEVVQVGWGVAWGSWVGVGIARGRRCMCVCVCGGGGGGPQGGRAEARISSQVCLVLWDWAFCRCPRC
jgi:hypothetical protein